MSQQQVHARRTHDQHTETAALADQADTSGARTVEATAALDHTDDLLDEIDALLTQEEGFARNFRQKGGQ